MKHFCSLIVNGTTLHTSLKPIRVNLSILFICMFSICYGATYTSTGTTTNWNLGTTWGGVSTPGSGDNVVIAAGTTVIINTSPGVTLGSITVNGILEFQSGTSRSIFCTNVSVASTGTFRTNASGTVTGHTLSVSGSITNGGTLDFYTNSGNAAASITFTGSSNTTFSGAGATTDIYSITVNKGSSPTYAVDLTVSNFTVRGVSTDVAGFLTLTNGTFKISGSFTMTNRVFTSATYSITSNTGFYLNNPNFTVAAQTGSVGWFGEITIDDGTFNVGSASNDNLYYGGSGANSVFVINGGALNVAGSLQPFNDTGNHTYYVDYTQTGGTVTCCTVGNTYPGLNGLGLPSMWITQYSSFTMSGGTIVIRGHNINANYDYDCSADTRSITGGTVQIGDASSGTAKRYGITGYFPNLVITNTSGNHSAEFYQKTYTPYIYLTTTLQSNTTLDANTNSIGATFVGDITMNSGSTFDAGTVTHTVKGNWINNGTLTYRTSTFYFNGSSLQTISGSANLNFYDVELNNSAGMALSPNTGVVTAFRHLLTFTSGKITLNDYDLELEASQNGSSGISGAGSSNFIITNGTGVLRRYNIGSAAGKRTTALYPIGYTSSTYTPVTLTVTSTTTTDNFSARVSPGVYSSGTSGTLYSTKTVDRTWDVSEGTAGGSNVQLTFQWTSSLETTSFTRNSCYVGHYTGGAWQVSGNAAASGSNPYTRTSGTQTSFSPFAIASGSSPLPIELLSFDAKPEGDHVLTKWSTASEINNDFFTLERSKDGADFEKLKNVPGAGNSDRILNYSETDESPLNGISYYRLKQTDFDGKTSYSDMVPIEFNSTSHARVQYNSTESTEATIHYNLSSNALVTIEIIDGNGKQVAVLFENQYQYFGNHQEKLNFEGSAGIYYVKIIINGTPTICKFVH